MFAYALTLKEWGFFYFLGELYDRLKKVVDRVECRIFSFDLGERPYPLKLLGPPDGWGMGSDVILH